MPAWALIKGDAVFQIPCEHCGTPADPVSGVVVYRASGSFYAKVSCHVCLRSSVRTVSGEVALALIISGADEVDPDEMPIEEREVAAFAARLDTLSPERIFSQLGKV